MPYESLAKIFHKDSSTARFATNERLATERREAPSTFRTAIQTSSGELFLAVPRELSLINERVLRRERRVSALLRGLPSIARTSLVYGLVIDEVVSTNDLEGVRSTRRQIREALEQAETPRARNDVTRFKELAVLYLGLSDPDAHTPETLEDLRDIYDTVMHGEDLGTNAPDGMLFRREPVDVVGRGGKVIHTGVHPESEIMRVLKDMLALANSPDIPETYSAILAHYIFEYVHPFYDGNGRTGRYLLALYLSRPFSILTSLSLSRTIAENRDSYYRSFKITEDPLNHGELTFFVLAMLETIEAAQIELIDRLETKSQQLEAAREPVEKYIKQHHMDDMKSEIIWQLVQTGLFGAFPDVTLDEIAHHIGLGTQATRRHLKHLEELELVELAGKRPLRFMLTEGARTMLASEHAV